MTDDEFLHAFTTGTLPNDQFHHRPEAIVSGIRHFAGVHGQGPRYHETMTRFWIWFVDHAMRVRPEVSSFEEFVTIFPMVLDKTLPFRHWTREKMMSSAARTAWVEPDLQALPMR
jgi:hypothetical protein